MSTIDSAALRAYRLPRIEIEAEPATPAKQMKASKHAGPRAELAAAGVLFAALLGLMIAIGAVVGFTLFR